MNEHDIGSVPVVDNDSLVGMVMDRDIAIRAFAKGSDASQVTAADVMTKNVVYCHAEDSITSAIRKMEENRIRRLLVVDSGNGWLACFQ